MQYDGLVYFRWMFMNITLFTLHKQVHEIPYTNVLQIMMKLIHVTTSTK
jgi:hypothetical protein